MAECVKVRYRSEWAARAALRAIQRKYEGDIRRRERGMHFCSRCRAWHLTSTSKSQIAPWASKRRRIGALPISSRKAETP